MRVSKPVADRSERLTNVVSRVSHELAQQSTPMPHAEASFSWRKF
jgi:hypothetical protein